jgi:hypothetical protein
MLFPFFHSIAIGEADILPRQQSREKLLGKVLRVLFGMTLPPHVSIEGIPIGSAKPFEGFPRLNAIAVASLGYHSPERRGKKAIPRGVPIEFLMLSRGIHLECAIILSIIEHY